MQVFKCALRVIRGHAVFPLVYIVGLSLMGLFMASSFDFSTAEGQFEREQADYAVVDRDGSALSAGIAEALDEQGTAVEVADDRRAFQDAVAKGAVDYLLVVPEGYGDAFMEAVHAGDDPPALDAAYSFYAMSGAFMDEVVGSYLGAARTLALADAAASQQEVARAAAEAVAVRAEAELIAVEGSVSEADRFAFYLKWSTYTLFAGITVCVGLLTATMGRADVRRRNLASPLPFAAYNFQLALACLVVTLGAWAWSFGVGALAFHEAVAQISLEGLAWCAASMLAFCLVPLALGYLMGALGASGLVSNAVGNIVGMLVSFLGGAWVPLDLMAPEVLALAHALPGYWYSMACADAAHMAAGSGLGAAVPVLQCIGVLVLFAVALLCVALAAGRARMRTSAAGGNRAAASGVAA